MPCDKVLAEKLSQTSQTKKTYQKWDAQAASHFVFLKEASMEIDGRTTSEEFINNTVNTLREAIPIIFRRKDIPKLFGGCLAVGTLANLGKNGPPYARQGKHAVYERDSFLLWYRSLLAK